MIPIANGYATTRRGLPLALALLQLPRKSTNRKLSPSCKLSAKRGGAGIVNINQTIRSKNTISPTLSDRNLSRLSQRSQLLPGLTGLREIRSAQLQRAVISLAGF